MSKDSPSPAFAILDGRDTGPAKAGHYVPMGAGHDVRMENVKAPAWEMIEPGRYMPRRTRGSFPGRELG
ncbi:MAG: hypothetical protein ACRD3C_00100 [Vicinamibacterales bacterium]